MFPVAGPQFGYLGYIIQNIKISSLYVQQKKETNIDLEQLDGE